MLQYWTYSTFHLLQHASADLLKPSQAAIIRLIMQTVPHMDTWIAEIHVGVRINNVLTKMLTTKMDALKGMNDKKEPRKHIYSFLPSFSGGVLSTQPKRKHKKAVQAFLESQKIVWSGNTPTLSTWQQNGRQFKYSGRRHYYKRKGVCTDFVNNLYRGEGVCLQQNFSWQRKRYCNREFSSDEQLAICHFGLDTIHALLKVILLL